MSFDIRYAGPTCEPGCTPLDMPVGSVAACPDAYEISIGEIRSVYISGVSENAGVIEAANKPSSWTSDTGYANVFRLDGFGDKPKASDENAPIPGFLNKVIDRQHSMNFDTTDSRQVVRDNIRKLQCGKWIAIWYVTHDGVAYGGADGIICQVSPGGVLTRGKTPAASNLVFTWNNKYDPESVQLTGAGSMTFNPGPSQFTAAPPPPITKKKAA